MDEVNKLHVGAGGQWEVTHYRKQIEKRQSAGAPREVIEALHRKLARSIDKWGDPDAPAEGEG